MAFRTRRQNRYRLMREVGFLPFEAQQLSKLSFKKAPFLRVVMRERLRELQRAIEEEWSKVAWKRAIYKHYVDNGWFEVRNPQRLSPWAMLRKYADDWKQRHPEYERLRNLRRKTKGELLSTTDKEVAKQPRGHKARRIRYLPEGGAEFID